MRGRTWRRGLYSARLALHLVLFGGFAAAIAANGHPVLAMADAAVIHGRAETAVAIALVAGFTVSVNVMCAIMAPRNPVDPATAAVASATILVWTFESIALVSARSHGAAMFNLLQRMSTWCPSGSCVSQACPEGVSHCFLAPAHRAARAGAAAPFAPTPDTSLDARPEAWVALLALALAGAYWSPLGAAPTRPRRATAAAAGTPAGKDHPASAPATAPAPRAGGQRDGAAGKVAAATPPAVSQSAHPGDGRRPAAAVLGDRVARRLDL